MSPQRHLLGDTCMTATHEVQLDGAALDIIYTLLTPHRDSYLWESRFNTTLPPEQPCQAGCRLPKPHSPDPVGPPVVTCVGVCHDNSA